ncbi:hypothetical protein Tco_1327446 [Tanacetum coccineum]
MPTVTIIAMTNELGVVAWNQREMPTVTNIAVTNVDVGSSKGELLQLFDRDIDDDKDNHSHSDQQTPKISDKAHL